MTDTDITPLRSLWRHYRRRSRDLDRARVELDDEIERVLAQGKLRQADIARLLGCSRQDIAESIRRQKRRREREEIE